MKKLNGFYKGINLGGWLSQCGKNYTKEHYNSFITKDDIKKISEMGLDHVRLPIDYNVIQNEDGTFITEHFSYIDNCIAWCEEFGLNIILDLHKTSGYVFSDLSCLDFFEKAELQNMFKSLWREIAVRYGNKPNRIAFELLNEITEFKIANDWNDIWLETVAEIRKFTKDTKIIVGGVFYNGIDGLKYLAKPSDENTVFTFHCYSPMIFTHQGAGWQPMMDPDFRQKYPVSVAEIRESSAKNYGDEDSTVSGEDEKEILSTKYFDKLFETAKETAEKYDIEIYCGEYGVIDHADTTSTLNWYKDIHAAFEKLKIGRAAWTYKSMSFGVTDDHYKDISTEIIDNL